MNLAPHTPETSELMTEEPEITLPVEDVVEKAWLEYSEKRKRNIPVAIPTEILESERFERYRKYGTAKFRTIIPTITTTDDGRSKIYPFGISREISFDLESFNRNTQPDKMVQIDDSSGSILVRYQEPETKENPRYLLFDGQNFKKIRSFIDQHLNIEK